MDIGPGHLGIAALTLTTLVGLITITPSGYMILSSKARYRALAPLLGLYYLAGSGHEPLILYREPLERFRPRRRVADWLHQTLGQDAPELVRTASSGDKDPDRYCHCGKSRPLPAQGSLA